MFPAVGKTIRFTAFSKGPGPNFQKAKRQPENHLQHSNAGDDKAKPDRWIAAKKKEKGKKTKNIAPGVLVLIWNAGFLEKHTVLP
jgi:hypothetical protein